MPVIAGGTPLCHVCLLDQWLIDAWNENGDCVAARGQPGRHRMQTGHRRNQRSKIKEESGGTNRAQRDLLVGVARQRSPVASSRQSECVIRMGGETTRSRLASRSAGLERSRRAACVAGYGCRYGLDAKSRNRPLMPSSTLAVDGRRLRHEVPPMNRKATQPREARSGGGLPAPYGENRAK